MGKRNNKVKQSIPKPLRYTISDFNYEFPTDDSCLEHIKESVSLVAWPIAGNVRPSASTIGYLAVLLTPVTIAGIISTHWREPFSRRALLL